MTWDAAREHCEGDGATLVSLRNVWTSNYVELLALRLKAPVWIGLNKAKVQSRKKDSNKKRFNHITNKMIW